MGSRIHGIWVRRRVACSLAVLVSVLVLGGGYGSGPFGCPSVLDFFCGSILDLLGSGPGAPSSGGTVSFEQNLGQSDPRYQFLAHGDGYAIFLSDSEVALHLYGEKPAAIRASLAGTQGRPDVETLEPLSGRVNYLLGRDPSKWITGVPTFARVKYKGVYPGVDLVYYGNGSKLEHDFIVAPGIDPNVVKMRFSGVDQMHFNVDGELLLTHGDRELIWQKPVIYQQTQGPARRIEGRYRLEADGAVGFEIGHYDRSRPLVIDPVINYATFVGRSGSETAARIALDASGNAYVTGGTNLSTYPVTPGAVTTYAGSADQGNVVVTKMNAAGTAIVYSTHFGGSGSEVGTGIAVDAQGNAYVVGPTDSPDFPSTLQLGPGATSDKGDCFVAKLSPDGTRFVYSTRIGGEAHDGCLAVAVNAAGNAYVTGATTSSRFPTTTGVVQPTFRLGVTNPGYDAFVAKLNLAGSALDYSTYLGGNGNDAAFGIAIDAGGFAYIAGVTSSPGGTSEARFPVSDRAFQKTYGGSGGQINPLLKLGDGFVAKLNPTATGIIYATYLGGERDDVALGIAVDTQGAAYVVGSTLSTRFPTTAGDAYKGSGGEDSWVAGDAFITKLSTDGSALAYSTLLGGARDDRAVSVAVDAAGNAWITGNTLSEDFPTSTDARQRQYRGQAADFFRTGDAFVAQIAPDGRSVPYSTYLGSTGNDWGIGIALDAAGGVLVSGGTSSDTFPTTPGSAQTGFGGAITAALPLGDGFIARFGDPPKLSIAAVTNSASGAQGGVAPGEMVSLYGVAIGPVEPRGFELSTDRTTVTTQVANARVWFDDIAAPLIFVSAQQSNAIVPYGIAGRATTNVVVEYNGARSLPLNIPVLASKPALFSSLGTGRGQGAILNEDSSVNSASNPAAKGSVVVLFGTGEGQTVPAGADGRLATSVFPKPALPVSVSIGGVALSQADILYAGAAPFGVAGFFQVNARLPQDVASGDVPVVVTVGTASSQTGLTVAVR